MLVRIITDVDTHRMAGRRLARCGLWDAGPDRICWWSFLLNRIDTALNRLALNRAASDRS